MPRFLLPSASIVLLVATACVDPGDVSTSAVATDTPLEARIDAAAADVLRDVAPAGLSIAVVRRGRPVLAKGYGYADLADRIPATATTIYRLASITKEFTAAAILHLAEQGRLTLDDPVVEHLPDHPGLDPRITLRHLLSHTSGIADARVFSALEETGGVGTDRGELIDLVASQPLDFEPGTQHSYSNMGFVLLGAVIEHVTGTSYGDYVRDEILRPMGLDRTFQCPDEQRPDAQWAHGYDVQYGTWTRALRLGRPPAFIDPPPINMAVVSSAGALCSTAIDLARWPGKLRTFLDPASLREMSRPTELADGTDVPYGLGMQIRTFGSHPAVSHGGVVNGFVGLVADFPRDDLSVAILINTRLLHLEQGLVIANDVLRAVFDEPSSSWSDPLEAPAAGDGSSS